MSTENYEIAKLDTCFTASPIRWAQNVKRDMFITLPLTFILIFASILTNHHAITIASYISFSLIFILFFIRLILFACQNKSLLCTYCKRPLEIGENQPDAFVCHPCRVVYAISHDSSADTGLHPDPEFSAGAGLHPDPEFSEDTDSALYNSAAVKTLTSMLIFVRFILTSLVMLCLLAIVLGICVVFGLGNIVMSILSFVVLGTAFAVMSIMHDRIALLRWVPLKCTHCSRCMEQRAREVHRKKETVIFYECPRCKLYVDSGATVGD